MPDTEAHEVYFCLCPREEAIGQSICPSVPIFLSAAYLQNNLREHLMKLITVVEGIDSVVVNNNHYIQTSKQS